jgi:hypothetical protein
VPLSCDPGAATPDAPDGSRQPGGEAASSFCLVTEPTRGLSTSSRRCRKVRIVGSRQAGVPWAGSGDAGTRGGRSVARSQCGQVCRGRGGRAGTRPVDPLLPGRPLCRAGVEFSSDRCGDKLVERVCAGPTAGTRDPAACSRRESVRPAGRCRPGPSVGRARLTGGRRRPTQRILRRRGLHSAAPSRSTDTRPATIPAATVDPAEVGELYRQGLTLAAIGARYGHGTDWARARVLAAGIPCATPAAGPSPRSTCGLCAESWTQAWRWLISPRSSAAPRTRSGDSSLRRVGRSRLVDLAPGCCRRCPPRRCFGCRSRTASRSPIPPWRWECRFTRSRSPSTMRGSLGDAPCRGGWQTRILRTCGSCTCTSGSPYPRSPPARLQALADRTRTG